MNLQFKRLIAQFFFFFTANLGAVGIKSGFCFPFFYCHACPASSAACPLRSFEISIYKVFNKEEPGIFNIKLLLFPLLILGTVGILSGRAICGWACPFGLLQRGTGKIARKIHKKLPILKRFQQSKVDRYLRYVKYVLLIFLIFLIPMFIGFMFTDVCPNGFLVGTIPTMILNPGGYVPATYFYIALVILVLFLILIFTIERGWCRYFCPLGAFLAPFNKVSMIHVAVEEKSCLHCNLCTDVCPMGIDVPNMYRDPECIYCGKCISACPKNVITFKRF